MSTYVFYMGEVEEHDDLPDPDNYLLGTWVCLIQRGEQCWGRLEEQPRIKQPPLKSWFAKTPDQAPKDYRTQLLILGG